MDRYQKRAYTLAEALLALLLISILVGVMTFNLKPGLIQADALLKASVNLYTQIDFGFKNLLAKRSANYSMLSLIAIDDTKFSIVDEGADEKLIAVLKKTLVALRSNQPSAQYLAFDITDENSLGPQKPTSEDDPTLINWKISDFTQGMILKNHAYLAIKLNGNCTTSETNIYHPATRLKHTADNSCGLLFFDVNGEDKPNKLMVDQYIISIGKLGVK